MFSKDHWSCFAFVETLCVEHQGVVRDTDRIKLRTNARKHPGFGIYPLGSYSPWKKEWGTRLKGFFEADASNSKFRLNQHDDWDCIEDFEVAGLLVNRGTGINPKFELTKRGQAIAAELREHKAKGGHFYQFIPSVLVSE